MARFAAAVLSVLALLAQPQALEKQQPPTIRSTALTVEVDATVQDARGEFLTDLRRQDFEILEGGVPQAIDTIFLITGRHSPASIAAGGPTDAEAVPRVELDRRVFIFVFDTDHIASPASLDRGRRAIGEFLAKEFTAGDLGGIVSDGRMIGNRLTSSVDELKAAADTVKPTGNMREKTREFREWPTIRDELEAIRIERNEPGAIGPAVARACTQEPEQCPQADMMLRQKSARLAQAFRLTAQNTLRSTQALANGLGKIPGRKTVIFLSDGFVVEANFEALATTVGRAGRTGVRFYTIDTRGLNRGIDSLESSAPDDSAGAPARFDMQGDATNSLAVDTGGLAIRNENNIARALSAVARDTGTYYVVGYRPVNQELDGKFRRIAVRVKRPGARIRARAGYLAVASPTPASAEPPPSPQSNPAVPIPVPYLPLAGTLSTVDLPAVGVQPFLPSSRALEGVEALAARIVPAATDSRAKDGWARYAKGDVEGARALLAEAAAGDAPLWVFYALGQSEFALRQFDRAIAAWTTVRSRAPDLREVYLDLADAYLQLGNLTSALAVMRDANTRWPSDPEFHNAIGVLHVRRSALDDAIGAFGMAAKSAPAEPLAYFNLGRAYEMRYARDTRYVPSLGEWVAPDADRRKAAENYRRYLELGGAYADQAREALLRLEWAR